MSTQNSNDWKPVRRTLVIGVNWIGDTIMTMPAIEAWRRTHHDAHLTVLVKKNLAALWELHSAPDNIATFEDTTPGTLAAGNAMKSGRFDRAIILPNSFRSALIPWLARIHERIGTPGQLRDPLLTRKVPTEATPGREHQAFEYFRLLGIAAPPKIETPRLKISEGAHERAQAQLQDLPRPIVGLIPGAARGPSKRWPAAHFAEAGKKLSGRGCGIILFGGPDDFQLCEDIRDQIGENSLNMAGRTSLKEWAAMMLCCSLVICNDSGGMHLAAAIGTPLVAIFGLTDPAKTGPLGTRSAIIRDETAHASRDIPRNDEAARKSLEAIPPQRVLDAAALFLDKSA